MLAEKQKRTRTQKNRIIRSTPYVVFQPKRLLRSFQGCKMINEKKGPSYEKLLLRNWNSFLSAGLV